MKVFFFPLVSITLFFCMGILLYSYTDFSWIILLSTLLIFLIASIFLQKKIKLKKTATALLYLIWVIIGIGVAKIHDEKHYKNHYTNFIKLEKQLIKIKITERLKPSEKYYKYYAEVTEVEQQKARGTILIYQNKKENNAFKISEKILLYENFIDLFHSKNPYEFSYANYLNKQHVYNQIFINSNYKTENITFDFNFYVDKLRQTLINSFNIHDFDNESQNFINAFLFGQRQDVSAEMNENYTQAGVIHILAISGLHIAILYGMLLYLFKAMQLGYKSRYTKLIITLLFLWTFAFITGLSASVVRSVTMFSIIAVALTFDRNQNIYNAMAISVLIILLFKPNFIFDVGFQLSYLSVFIIIICNPLYKKLHFTKYKIVHFIADLVSISLCAQLFLLPVLLYYFHQFPTLFLVANLIVIPLSNIILYALIFVLLLNFIMPAFAIKIGKVLSYLIQKLNEYIEWIASFKEFTIQNIPFNELLLLSSYFVIISILLVLFKINYKRIQTVLISIFIFQLTYFYSDINQNSDRSGIIWNSRASTFISLKINDKTEIITSDSIKNERLSNSIRQQNFSGIVKINPIKNYYVQNETKILVLDTILHHQSTIKPDVIVLINSAKINLERVLQQTEPKLVIADGSNFKNVVSKWEATCKQKNIPFHNTNEMGYYTID